MTTNVYAVCVAKSLYNLSSVSSFLSVVMFSVYISCLYFKDRKRFLFYCTVTQIFDADCTEVHQSRVVASSSKWKDRHTSYMANLSELSITMTRTYRWFSELRCTVRWPCNTVYLSRGN